MEGILFRRYQGEKTLEVRPEKNGTVIFFVSDGTEEREELNPTFRLFDLIRFSVRVLGSPLVQKVLPSRYYSVRLADSRNDLDGERELIRAEIERYKPTYLRGIKVDAQAGEAHLFKQLTGYKVLKVGGEVKITRVEKELKLSTGRMSLPILVDIASFVLRDSVVSEMNATSFYHIPWLQVGSKVELFTPPNPANPFASKLASALQSPEVLKPKTASVARVVSVEAPAPVPVTAVVDFGLEPNVGAGSQAEGRVVADSGERNMDSRTMGVMIAFLERLTADPLDQALAVICQAFLKELSRSPGIVPNRPLQVGSIEETLATLRIRLREIESSCETLQAETASLEKQKTELEAEIEGLSSPGTEQEFFTWAEGVFQEELGRRREIPPAESPELARLLEEERRLEKALAQLKAI